MLRNKNLVLKKRVSKLLEYKSNNFKKKFYLLSSLVNSNINKNEKLMNEFSCLCNSLIESNAVKPSLDSINELLLKSFSNNYKKVENYNKFIDLKFKQNLNESLIESELNLIEIKNISLDAKLYDILIESIKNKRSLLFETESFEDEEKSIRNARKAYFDELKKQNDFFFGTSSSKPDASLESTFDEIPDYEPGDAIVNIEDDMLDYDSQTKHIKSDKFDKTRRKPVLSKDEKIKNAAFNSLKSVTEKRNFIIVDEIKKYLIVMKVPNYTKQFSKSMFDQEAIKFEKTGKLVSSISMASSGLTQQKIDEYKQQLFDYIKEKNYNFALMSETYLGKLLVKSAGSYKENVDEFFEWLNLEYPKGVISNAAQEDDYEILSDSEVESLNRYNEYYDNHIKYSDDKPIDIEEFELLPVDEQDYLVTKSRELISNDEDHIDVDDFETNSPETNLTIITHMLDDYGTIEEKEDGTIKIKVDGKKFKPTQISREQYVKALSEYDALKQLMKKMTRADGSNAGIIQGAKMSAEEIEDFFNKLSSDITRKGEGKGLTLNDIAAASRGNFSGGSGIKRVLINSWNKLSFYSILDQDQKSRIYELFADRFFEGLELLGLIKDKTDDDEEETVVSLETIDKKIDDLIAKITVDSELDSEEKKKKKLDIKAKHEKYKQEYEDMLLVTSQSYEKIKKVIVNKQNIKNFLDGTMYSEIMEFKSESDDETSNMDRIVFEKLNEISQFFILYEVLYKKSGLRFFITEILDEYFKINYANVDIERQIGKKVKDYFNDKYPTARIDASNNITGSTDVESCNVDEGRMLFNPVVRWIVGKTGYKFSKKGLKSAADQQDSRREFFVNNFVDIVKKYNEKDAKVKLEGLNGGEFELDDALDLYYDINDPNGIIGKFVKENLENFSEDLCDDIENFIMGIKQDELCTMCITALGYSELHNSSDLFITGKEETESRNKTKTDAVNYRKQFGKEISAISSEY